MDRGEPKGRIERARKLKQDRATYEPVWRDLGLYLWPAMSDFLTPTSAPRTKGDTRRPRVYDDDPRRAVENFVAGMMGTMAPEHTRWAALTVTDTDSAKWPPHAEWLDTVSHKVLGTFAPAQSSFYAEAPNVFRGLGVFGSAPFYSDFDRKSGRWIDKAWPLSEVLIELDPTGQVNAFYRFFRWPISRLAQQWGAAALSEKLRQKLDQGKDTEEVEILHSVVPNPDYSAGMIGPKGFVYASFYEEVEAAHPLSRGGFYTFPLQFPVWERAPSEDYGRGPGHNALADIRALNIMKRDFLITGNFQARPVNLAADDDALDPVHMAPGKTLYGAINPQTGRAMVQQYAPGGDLVITETILQQQREAIRDAFFFTLMQLVGRTGMTATEVLERQEEKLRLIGPHVGNINHGFFSPLIFRRFDMMWRMGMLPPPPEGLADAVLSVRYESPMAKIQKSADGAAISRAVATAAGWAQFNPDVMDVFDLDRAAMLMSDAYAAPASIIRDPRQVRALRDQRQQMTALAQAVQLGGEGASMAQKLSQAQATMGGRNAA